MGETFGNFTDASMTILIPEDRLDNNYFNLQWLVNKKIKNVKATYYKPKNPKY